MQRASRTVAGCSQCRTPTDTLYLVLVVWVVLQDPITKNTAKTHKLHCRTVRAERDSLWCWASLLFTPIKRFFFGKAGFEEFAFVVIQLTHKPKPVVVLWGVTLLLSMFRQAELSLSSSCCQELLQLISCHPGGAHQSDFGSIKAAVFSRLPVNMSQYCDIVTKMQCLFTVGGKLLRWSWTHRPLTFLSQPHVTGSCEILIFLAAGILSSRSYFESVCETDGWTTLKSKKYSRLSCNAYSSDNSKNK